MILIGWRKLVKILATINFRCSNCSQACAHQIFRRWKFFTVFLIPVIPVSRPEYRSSCVGCGARAYLTKEDAQLLVDGPGPQADRVIELMNATHGIR